MPTENELKYVLKLGCEDEFKNLVTKKKDIKHILQGYLVASKGMSLRIRKAISNKTVCTLTYKQKVANRVVEIEKKIDYRDFSDLWHMALNKIEKIRYVIPIRDYLWEIDFFKDHHHKTYFAQAEVEMVEGLEKPDSIPCFINDNLVYSVPRSDGRFASKRLSHVKYAKDLYNSLWIEVARWPCGTMIPIEDMEWQGPQPSDDFEIVKVPLSSYE